MTPPGSAAPPEAAFRIGWAAVAALCHPHPSWPVLAPADRAAALLWCSLGADLPDGAWRLYGARRALHDAWMPDAPGLDEAWADSAADDPAVAGTALGYALARQGIDVRDLPPGLSRWIRRVNVVNFAEIW